MQVDQSPRKEEAVSSTAKARRRNPQKRKIKSVVAAANPFKNRKYHRNESKQVSNCHRPKDQTDALIH